MKLKEQINKQRAYAIRMLKEAKNNNDSFHCGYWQAIMDAMDWVQESRDTWTYMDKTDMPQDKGSAF